jgi:hypothetical protein
MEIIKIIVIAITAVVFVNYASKFFCLLEGMEKTLKEIQELIRRNNRE